MKCCGNCDWSNYLPNGNCLDCDGKKNWKLKEIKMSIVQLCPYDVNGENCKYETHYGEPNFSKCKNCDRTNNICKTSKTILKGDKKMTKDEMKNEEWYVILNMNCKYEICRMCPKSGLFKGSYKECEEWIKQKKKEEMKDELKDRITMALKDPILQQGFEIICKDLAISEHDREHNDYELTEVYKKLEQLKIENAELKEELGTVKMQKAGEKSDLVWKLKTANEQKAEQLTEAKAIMNIAIEGIKYWGIVGGNERPLEKEAGMLFNLFLDKAEEFLKDNEVEK